MNLKRISVWLPMLIALLVASCVPSKEEKELDGRWYGEGESTLGNAGLRQELTMKFDADTHEAKIVSEYLDGTNRVVASYKLIGEWKISGETLKLEVSDKNVSIESEALAEYSKTKGVSVESLTNTIKEEIADDIKSMSDMKIEDLDDDELELEADGNKIEMKDGTRPERVVTAAAPAAEPVAAPAAEKPRPANGMVTLKGKIGKYPIEMQVDFGSSSVNGKYRYTRTGSGGWLVLTGTKSGSYVNLYEFNDKGEQTGEFSGTYDGSVFSGTFVNYKGTTYSFTLS